MMRATRTITRLTGRAVLAALLSALLLASVAGCGAATTSPTYHTYRFCICQKTSNQWTAGEQRSLTWLAQESNTTADPTPRPVTLTLEAHGPFATVTPLPPPEKVRQAPLLLTSTITTSDHESHDQIVIAQVPSAAQPGNYVMMESTLTGTLDHDPIGWMEYHAITVSQ
jgi:hypothetical protein